MILGFGSDVWMKEKVNCISFCIKWHLKNEIPLLNGLFSSCYLFLWVLFSGYLVKITLGWKFPYLLKKYSAQQGMKRRFGWVYPVSGWCCRQLEAVLHLLDGWWDAPASDLGCCGEFTYLCWYPHTVVTQTGLRVLCLNSVWAKQFNQRVWLGGWQEVWGRSHALFSLGI